MADTAVIHYILEEVNVDYKMLDLKSSFFNSAGSRPWDKGGPQSSRPFDGGGGRGQSPQNFFLLFRPQFGLKIRIALDGAPPLYLSL